MENTAVNFFSFAVQLINIVVAAGFVYFGGWASHVFILKNQPNFTFQLNFLYTCFLLVLEQNA